ncbi:MAG: methyltransferase [Rhodospirillaceae bacterium]|jgi:trimethylamine---corrinoid protein Co-methyltransferase|nr:methyltransferase [Rhodospirillaceae bacterium]MBT5242699.1 methyltransferase [Rhodospirillaceae bacterium]MBT5561512.1 methyltransferase [Rhodospirillaceae bacterium]MBT6241890.1 methyltransferase [Rhodospirillaceae bacterium]MBT7138691.1 methyltransferase [Rhodospirillaceae bacterium]
MTSASPDLSRRRGGRSARQALRAQPLTRDARPVHPGMENGNYRPLSEPDVQKIHHAILHVLENVGFSKAPPSCVEAITAVGGVMGDDGRLRLPPALVEDTIANANRDFQLCGQKPEYDMSPHGKRLYFGTGGAAINIVDAETGDFRESTMKDLFDIARMVDGLEHIHYCQRPVVVRDTETSRDLDFNTLYACVSGTSKHVGTSFVNPAHVTEALEMLHMIAGGEKQWRERPFVSQSNCFVVPPMTFEANACAILETAARGGMPVLLLSAGQAGATAPAALAGAVVQATAETLMGLVYINAVVPKAKCMIGIWPFVSDLRTGSMSGGSGEQALLMSAAGQMGRFYDLPTSVASAMTDSKIPDAQSGSEKGYNHALVANAGTNLIQESAGMHASLLAFCYESLVIDNDTIGAVQRTIRGIDVNDETLSLDVISETCERGPGHYLGHNQTIERMQSDYVYPVVGDRMSPNEWTENGSQSVVQRARVESQNLLDNHWPDHISTDLDQAIRDKFNVKLPLSERFKSK